MKNILALLITFLMLIPSYAKADVLVGTVDVQTVLLSIKQGVSLRSLLKNEFKKREKHLKKAERAIKEAEKKFNKQSLGMSDAAQAKKRRELQIMVNNLRQKMHDFQKEISNMEKKLKAPILNKIQNIVLKVSKDSNVDITFEASAKSILYSKSQKDLTSEVIKLYDKTYPE